MQLGGIPLGTNGVNTAAGLRWQRLAQGLELRQQIPHGPAGHHCGDGLAPAGDQHGLAALHRIEQAGELGLGFSHFAALGIIIYWPMPGLLTNASEDGHLSCR